MRAALLFPSLLGLAGACASPASGTLSDAGTVDATTPPDLSGPRSCWGLPLSAFAAPEVLSSLAGNDPGSVSLSTDGLVLAYAAAPTLGARPVAFEVTRSTVGDTFIGGLPIRWSGAIHAYAVTTAARLGPLELVVGADGDLWTASRDTTSSAWNEPTRLPPPVQTASVEDYASTASDGLRLLFMRNDGSAPLAWQIHQVVRGARLAPWSNDTVVAVAGVDPQQHALACPTLSADGRRLFFSSTIFSATDGDVYFSERPGAGGAFGPAVRVDTVSSPAQHDSPDAVSPDGCELYTHRFTHDGTGSPTLYVSHR